MTVRVISLFLFLRSKKLARAFATALNGNRPNYTATKHEQTVTSEHARRDRASGCACAVLALRRRPVERSTTRRKGDATRASSGFHGCSVRSRCGRSSGNLSSSPAERFRLAHNTRQFGCGAYAARSGRARSDRAIALTGDRHRS